MATQYQEDSMSVLGFAKDSAMFMLNPMNKYRYSPSAWSMSRGAIHINTQGIGFKVANNVAGRFGKLFGMTQRTADMKQKVKSALGGFGSKLGLSGIPKRGWFGVSGFDEQSLFKWTSDTQGKFKSVGTSYVDDFVKQYKTSGQLMSRRAFVDAAKGEFAKLGADTSSRSVRSMAISDYSLYKKGTDLRQMNFSHAKEILKGKIKGGNEQLAYINNVNARLDSLPAVSRRRFLSKHGSVANYIASESKSIQTTNHLLKKQLWGLRGKQAGLGALKIGARGLVAVGKFSALASSIMIGSQILGMVANPIAQGSIQAVDNAFNSFAQAAKPELGGQLNMAYLSQGAATERQRAIQAISKSRINGRSQFGNEAQFMHM